MPRVRFLSTQQRQTGGVAEIEIDATDFRTAVTAIRERFPAFSESELMNCSVAIDGRIVTRPLLERLGPHSELVFVSRMAAG